MRVVYHPDAETELLDAVRFYERRLAGLGQRFLREFEAAIAAIQETPEQWQVMEGDTRRYVMRRFPFSIQYRVDSDQLRILVVQHHSREPGYWFYRLND